LNFVSGNLKKYEEVCAILKPELPDVEIKQITIDIPELQGEPEEIVRNKLRLALDKAKGPLIVEDTSLCFNALHGLPGPYIKSFLTKLGPSGLYKMVKPYDDQTAYAQCIFGMAKGKRDEPKIFIGKTDGEIVDPRGPNNFGWDPTFQPKGFDKTYAEMDSEVKNSISHRYKALRELLDWLKNHPDYI
jgi:inosine triphosphate pyrophosphatase